MKKFWILLLAITILGAGLRILKLDKNPNHLGNDEISIAYDSYSVRLTGMDEHHKKLPLSFVSHRDYKAPLYAYLNMPFNFVFGNNEYGVRFLSAFAGTLAIILIAVLGRLLVNEKVALMAAFLLALNPQSIYASRMAFESNLASVILLLAIFCLFKFKKENKNYLLLLSGLFFGFSLWAYHTEKGLSPLLMLAFPLLWIKEIKFKKWFLMWVMAFLVILPIFIDFIKVQTRDPFNRASSQIWYQGVSIQNYLATTDDYWIKKGLKVIIDPIYRYTEHFGINFLFTEGMDIFPKNEPLNFGWFLLATLPLLLIGLVKIKPIFGQNSKAILMWWLICPIVPSLTYGQPSSVRNLPFIMPTILIMAGGLFFIWSKYKNYFWVLLTLILINFFYFSVAYFIHFPKITGDNFQYGYKQALEEIKKIESNYETIIVETRFGEFGQYVGLPRLYWGYWGAFDAWKMANRVNDECVDKYCFRNIDWNDEDINGNSVYVVSTSNPTVNESIKKLRLWKTIFKPDQQPQFLIYIPN